MYLIAMLLGITGLSPLLLCDECVDIPFRQGDLVTVLLPQQFPLSAS
jgi:hypothetical protein